MKIITYKTTSTAQTKKIAKLFAEELLETKPGKGAFVILFKGDLGAGKTTFIQGLMRGMGIRRRIASPTFTLLRSYALPALLSPSPRALSFRNFGPRIVVRGKLRRESIAATFTKIHHFDCYRMTGEREMNDLGFKEMVKDPQNIILIEWPERIKKALPRNKVTISFEYGDTLTERIIEVKSKMK
jgi:tRNA threonylcarbamoyladenosine biosynthesis protein TsaE